MEFFLHLCDIYSFLLRKLLFLLLLSHIWHPWQWFYKSSFLTDSIYVFEIIHLIREAQRGRFEPEVHIKLQQSPLANRRNQKSSLEMGETHHTQTHTQTQCPRGCKTHWYHGGPPVAQEPGSVCHLDMGGGFVRGVLKPNGTCFNHVGDHLAWHTVYQ